jgi:hypothetical protein
VSLSRSNNRFATYDADGDLIALVAEGLPEWPADGNLAGISDADLSAMYDALSAEAATMRENPDTIDVARATEIAAHAAALLNEVASRLAAADEGGTEGGTEPGGTTDPVPVPTPAPSPTTSTDEDRATALALLEALGNIPAPTVLEASVIGQSVSPEAIAAAVTAGVAPIAEAFTAAMERIAVPASPRRARGIGDYRPADRAPGEQGANGRRHGELGILTAAPDNGIFPTGHQFASRSELVEATRQRIDNLGKSTSTVEEKVVVATVRAPQPPANRDLRPFREASSQAVREFLQQTIGPDAMGIDPWTGEEKPIGRGGIVCDDIDAITASGGLSAPVDPYYPQLFLGQAARPVLDSMPSMVADRGGIRLVLPASIGTLSAATIPGEYPDGVTNNSTTFTSATATFLASDVGSPIVQVGASSSGSTSNIPAGTIIEAVGSTTSITLSQASTGGSVTAVPFAIRNRNPYNLGPAVGLVTAAQDAAGPPNTLKYTYDVPLGTQAEHDVFSTYASLQYANLTARTFPEQVELNILIANALQARVAETACLDYITGWSTLLTASKTFGTARQLLAQIEHMAAVYRQDQRMDPGAVLRLLIPAWALNAMRGDLISTFLGGSPSDWGLSDEELVAFFRNIAVLPSWYQDGPSDISQLFAAIGSGAVNTGGVNNATPVAIPDYPGQGSSTSFRTKVVTYLWGEGTWIGLTTGELNLGLVRDSFLNSQNRFRNFEEGWETPAYVGARSFRCVHTVAADGTYGAATAVVLGAGNGL